MANASPIYKVKKLTCYCSETVDISSRVYTIAAQRVVFFSSF